MNNHQSTRRSFLRAMAAAASSVTAPVFLPSSVLGKTAEDDWELGPFVKHKEPVLQPTPDSVFTCPIRDKEVRWEEQNTYNPAAVVRGGKVYILYRADDRSPDLGWGRTCRIGLAHSEDGIHFTRHERPVLYPDNDEWKKYEWEGGCEDPHIIEDEDGAIALLRDDGILLMTQGGHPRLGAWTLRQSLIDRNDLTTVLKYQKGPFLYPEHEWEKRGMTGNTTVSNGVVPFKGKWMLYYGAADRVIGLATCGRRKTE